MIVKVNEIDKYLTNFGEIDKLSVKKVCEELDRVWSELKLDNKKSLKLQADAIAEFYSHPVWILNGILSEVDPV